MENINFVTCFTGHRNIYGYDYKDIRYVKLIKTLDKYLLENDFYAEDNVFVSGGALGFDTLCFQMIDKASKSYILNNVLAIPFERQSIKWSEKDKIVYEDMKQIADEVIYVDTLDKYKIKTVPIGMYHPAKMQKRNNFMVDNSDVVISCWNGKKEKSGTLKCIKYARKKGKKIINIDPNSLEIKEI